MMVGDGPEKKSREYTVRIRYFRQSNLLETVMKSIKFYTDLFLLPSQTESLVWLH
jgi:hypothetical protein